MTPEFLEMFVEPMVPVTRWPDKPTTIGNALRLSIHHGWLASSIPFGKTLSGPETVWKESLQLTESGKQAIGG